MARPALYIVSNQDYQNRDNQLPHPDTIREALLDIMEESGWGHEGLLYDIRRQGVDIQHELPPTEPYDAKGVVVVLGQIPTDNRRLDGVNTDALDEMLDGLYSRFDDIEVWIDSADIR